MKNMISFFASICSIISFFATIISFYKKVNNKKNTDESTEKKEQIGKISLSQYTLENTVVFLLFAAIGYILGGYLYYVVKSNAILLFFEIIDIIWLILLILLFIIMTICNSVKNRLRFGKIIQYHVYNKYFFITIICYVLGMFFISYTWFMEAAIDKLDTDTHAYVLSGIGFVFVIVVSYLMALSMESNWYCCNYNYYYFKFKKKKYYRLGDSNDLSTNGVWYKSSEFDATDGVRAWDWEDIKKYTFVKDTYSAVWFKKECAWDYKHFCGKDTVLVIVDKCGLDKDKVILYKNNKDTIKIDKGMTMKDMRKKYFDGATPMLSIYEGGNKIIIEKLN